MSAQGMFTIVSALEVDADDYSDDAGDEEDNDHDYPAVMLVYPMWLLAVYSKLSALSSQLTMICVHCCHR